MADRPKVKVKDRIRFIKKQIVYLPILLFLPIYITNPSEKLLVMLSIVIVFHFLCFMSPVYMIKYLIDKMNFNQKFVDVMSFISCIGVWGFYFLDWFYIFFYTDLKWEFPAGLFLIPFFAFLKIGLGILFLTFLYKIYTFYKQADKE